jgi:hypothetical protein
MTLDHNVRMVIPVVSDDKQSVEMVQVLVVIRIVSQSESVARIALAGISHDLSDSLYFDGIIQPA